MAMTNGMFELDAVLGRREGGEAIIALESAGPSRTGTAESVVGLLGSFSESFLGNVADARPSGGKALRMIGCRAAFV